MQLSSIIGGGSKPPLLMRVLLAIRTQHLLAAEVSEAAAMTTQEVTTTTIHIKVEEKSRFIFSALLSYFWSGETFPKARRSWPLGVSNLSLTPEVL